jgi:capsule polysaccharide export protein KpsE/RkpR
MTVSDIIELTSELAQAQGMLRDVQKTNFQDAERIRELGATISALEATLAAAQQRIREYEAMKSER